MSKEEHAINPFAFELIRRLDAVLQDETLPEGLLHSDVLYADAAHHAHVHIYALMESCGGIDKITGKDLDRAAAFFRDMLLVELETRKEIISKKMH